VVTGVGVVMTVSSGQVGPLVWNLSSARYTQLEDGGRVNCSVSCGIVVMVLFKHTLTRESQEMMLGLMALSSGLDDDVPSWSAIRCTAVPLCGQLNITTSTLCSLKFG